MARSKRKPPPLGQTPSTCAFAFAIALLVVVVVACHTGRAAMRKGDGLPLKTDPGIGGLPVAKKNPQKNYALHAAARYLKQVETMPFNDSGLSFASSRTQGRVAC